MFSQVSVILFTEGCVSQHVLWQTPLRQTPPGHTRPGRHPLGRHNPGIHPQKATAADSFHRCLSFCSQGECIPACTTADTSQADTPPPRQTPPRQKPLPLGRHPLGRHPPGRHPWADTPRQPLQRTVRILLECILVAY